MDVSHLYRLHHSSLVRYLVRYCGDVELAEDAAQEAFVRFSESPPKRDDEVRAWLFTVATNVVRDAWRSRHRHSDLLAGHESPGPDPADDPSETAGRAELRERVRAALDALSDRDRTVLLMREEGFKHREIGDAVGISTASVGTVIARALDKLAVSLPRGVEGP